MKDANKRDEKPNVIADNRPEKCNNSAKPERTKIEPSVKGSNITLLLI